MVAFHHATFLAITNVAVIGYSLLKWESRRLSLLEMIVVKKLISK